PVRCAHVFSPHGPTPPPRRPPEVQGFSPTDLHVEPLVAALDERAELINREEVAHAVAQLLSHVAGIVRKGLPGIAVLPTTIILQCLRQIPMIQRRKWCNASSD